MIFVNSIDRFAVTPWMLQHHREGMSFNDTIAPIFIFVVGMGYRLSLRRRIERHGPVRARVEAARRYLLLTGIGFVVYWGYYWDALTDIGIAGLLALPFVMLPTWARALTAFVWLAAYQALFSLTPYGGWVMAHSLNGGPCGPLSWGFILLMGTVAYDLMESRDSRVILRGCLAWGAVLCAAGWALKFEWPGVKAEWPFTQYGMSAPYPLYATGLCFATLLVFHLLCDRARIEAPHLTVLGRNPLVLYLLQGLLVNLTPFVVPDSAPVWLAAATFAVNYTVCYALARVLHARNIVVKL